MRMMILLCCIMFSVCAGAAPIEWDADKEPCALATACAVYWHTITGSLPDMSPDSADFFCVETVGRIQHLEWVSKAVKEPTRAQLDAVKATAEQSLIPLRAEKDAELQWDNSVDVRTATKLAGKDKADFIAEYKKEATNTTVSAVSP